MTHPVWSDPPRPRGYRGRRRRPNLLHAALDAVMAFGRALYAIGLMAEDTRSPHEGGYGGGVKRAAGAPAPRDGIATASRAVHEALTAMGPPPTTDPGPGGVPQTPPPDSAEDGTR